MAFKVFLSYSTEPEDQVIVWRLQTLAAAHGIHVYVPPRGNLQIPPISRAPVLPQEVRKAIDQSDCVLAIITSRTSAAVEHELNYALGRNKLIIPIVEATVQDRAFLASFPHVFEFSRSQFPGKIEAQVVSFLKQQEVSKSQRQIVGALIAIGLGLLLLPKEQ